MQIKCRSEYMLVFELFFIFVQCNGVGFLDVINFYQNVLNRWSENFWQKAASQGEDFLQEDNVMWQWPDWMEHCSQLPTVPLSLLLIFSCINCHSTDLQSQCFYSAWPCMPWFMCWFRRYRNCLLCVYLTSFLTFFFPYAFLRIYFLTVTRLLPDLSVYSSRIYPFRFQAGGHRMIGSNQTWL